MAANHRSGSVELAKGPVDSNTRPNELGLEVLPSYEQNSRQRGDLGEDGTKNEGSDDSSEQEVPMTFKRAMAFLAMAFLLTGSQVNVYLFGGIPPYIYGDIGGQDRFAWSFMANLLAFSAICPFVGSVSDLIGRRNVALLRTTTVILGCIIASIAKDMNIFICGMTLCGFGAGIDELTAIAATSEMAPVAKRGKYVAFLVLSILPMCPSVLWAQLIATRSNWRYVGLVSALWAFIGLVLTVIFYHPPPRVNSQGLSRRQILGRIDYFGGLLSISGVLLFMMGLQWGGYQYSWTSTHVLVPLIFGILLMLGFVAWEKYGARYPMFPRRAFQSRSLTLTLVITFISGANLFSLSWFWPIQSYNMYDHDPIGVGVRALPLGFGIVFGSCIALWALTVFRGRIREIMLISSIAMTAGTGVMATAQPNNLHKMWAILSIAALGIGGLITPAAVVCTILCPDDVIATMTAITLSIRFIGGSIGYCIYTNIFVARFKQESVKYIGGTLLNASIFDPKVIGNAIILTSASHIDQIGQLPGIRGNEALFRAVVDAGKVAYAESYKWVYIASVAFGTICVIASVFLEDISKYMDNHVAVVI